MTLYLRQGDDRWRAAPLGTGGLTIGRAGCLVTCLCEAVMHLRDGIPQEPHIVARELWRSSCFVGSALIVPNAAEALGLVAGARVGAREGDGAIRTAIRAALEHDGKSVVLLHVDHDAGRPHGDPEADHWVLGVRLDPVDEYSTATTSRRTWDVVAADPATGEPVRISLDSLDGVSVWGVVPRRYRVLEVVPLSAAS